MIEALDVVKTYRSQSVLNGASLAVEAGECAVLTGDNGSGKTTLLHVIVGLRRLDSGRIVWKEQTLTGASQRAWRSARERWGFLPQQVFFPPQATVKQLLKFHVRIRRSDFKSALAWLEQVGLGAELSKRVEELSGGMQQRLGIALSLFFEPELIVMDEPASSLDPNWRGALVKWSEDQIKRGAAMLVTSQLHESWGNNVNFYHCAAGKIRPAEPDAMVKA